MRVAAESVCCIGARTRSISGDDSGSLGLLDSGAAESSLM